MEEMALEALNQISPLLDNLQPLITKLSWILGGVFGVYLILILVRVYYERKKVRILEDIRYDLDQLNIHNNIPFSGRRKRIIKKIFFKFFKKR